MDAVIFDLDGVLVDSERIWDEVRRAVVAENGGTWREEATRAQQGMSTPEWARYLVEELGARLTPPEIATIVVKRMAARYAERPPLIDGAVDVVRAVAKKWPVAIASSSPVILIKGFLDVTGLPVGAAVSSEQVGAGKPAPDVYLRAAELLGVAPHGMRGCRGHDERVAVGAGGRDGGLCGAEPALPAGPRGAEAGHGGGGEDHRLAGRASFELTSKRTGGEPGFTSATNTRPGPASPTARPMLRSPSAS